MTNPSGESLPVGAALAQEFGEDVQEASGARSDGPTVGADDAEADAVNSGADGSLRDSHRDSDGVPVGQDDVEEDKRQSGA